MTMTIRQLKEEKLKRVIVKRIELSRDDFWEFCKTDSPDFYKEDRWYLRVYCWVLQALYEKRLTKQTFSEYCQAVAPQWFIDSINWDGMKDNHVFTKLIINMPPRHGKSRTLILFCQWVLGQDKTNKIITASYNEDLATDFSRYTRDGISKEKIFSHDIVFSDIFPDTRIKKGDSSYRQWSLEGQFFTYKGAGLGGSITGKGGNILIVDDPIKNAEEAYNERVLDKQWQWYTGTFLSRLEESGERPIEIINMTRWSKKDLCGHVLNEEGADEWFQLLMEVCYNGEMLCEELLSKKRYMLFKKVMDDAIFYANYHQKPIDIKGRLYPAFKTYDDIPKDKNGHALFERIINYTDTADTGSDFLCSIVAGVYKGEAYVLDVYYTKEGMEVTEPKTAEFLVLNNVNFALIESNNGGRGFARNVEREILETYNTRKVIIRWFHQSKNKIARIHSNSNFVMEHIYFPVNWKHKWPEYYKAMTEYQKEGKNKNDDAPDATTGIAEMLTEDMDRPKPRARSVGKRR